MSNSLRARLSLFIFVQYFAGGVWINPLGTYMSKTLHFDSIIGVAYGMVGVGAIVSTLFLGVLADRFIAAQKLLSILSVLSGLTLFWIAYFGYSPRLFLIGMLLHCLCFIGAIPLGTTIVLSNISDAGGQFPGIRVFGSIAYIVSGILVGLMPGAALTTLPLRISGTAYLLLGMYALTLPDSPPRARGPQKGLLAMCGLDILKGLKDRTFWVFMACVLVMLVPNRFYDGYANNFLTEKGAYLRLGNTVIEPTAIQSLGPVCEALTMLMLPLFLKRWGIKRIMIAGMASWALRFSLWAFGFHGAAGILPMLIAGIALHGFCYDFFFVTGLIYMDRAFPAATRARAQSFYWFMTYGIGVTLGSNAAGVIYNANTTSFTEHNWTAIWLFPVAISMVAMIVFALFFTDRSSKVTDGALQQIA